MNQDTVTARKGLNLKRPMSWHETFVISLDCSFMRTCIVDIL